MHPMRPHSRHLLASVAALLSLAGCSSTVSSVTGSVDGGGDAEVSLPDVATPTDAPLSCASEARSSAAIRYTGPDEVAWDCRATRPTPGSPALVMSRTAAVISALDDATGSTLALDFCSPAADCIPRRGTLRIEAPGFTLRAAPAGLRTGQFVQIRSRATWSWGCTMQVEVSNAPTWDGEVNTVRQGSVLLAAAASGEGTALPEAPFEVTRRSIGCVMPGTDCGGGRPEVFALSFQGHCRDCLRDPDPVVVTQGATGTLQVDDLTYAARNLLSFNSGACDDYWNYSWTVRERGP